MTLFASVISSEDELRSLFDQPSHRAVAKQIDRLDEHCRRLIGLSPFVAVGTANADGTCDVSPKGGPPGFVKVLDDRHLAFGELPGNNRLDGFANLLRTPSVGLLFMIPGLGETFRVNGRARIVTDAWVLEACEVQGRRPRLALGIEVVEAFIHCAKALRRSRLWDPATWPEPESLPSAGAIFAAHTGLTDDPDGSRTTASLEAAYAAQLWNAAQP